MRLWLGCTLLREDCGAKGCFEKEGKVGVEKDF